MGHGSAGRRIADREWSEVNVDAHDPRWAGPRRALIFLAKAGRQRLNQPGHLDAVDGAHTAHTGHMLGCGLTALLQLGDAHESAGFYDLNFVLRIIGRVAGRAWRIPIEQGLHSPAREVAFGVLQPAPRVQDDRGQGQQHDDGQVSPGCQAGIAQYRPCCAGQSQQLATPTSHDTRTEPTQAARLDAASGRGAARWTVAQPSAPFGLRTTGYWPRVPTCRTRSSCLQTTLSKRDAQVVG